MNAKSRKIRVLFVIPGSPDGASMIFTRREADSVEREGAVVERFFLRSRTNVIEVARECVRLKKVIREFEPDVVHAQFGTVTALVSAVVSPVPLVITFRGSDLNYVPTDGRLRSVVSQGCSQLAALRAERIVCVSPALRRRLLVGGRRAVVMTNGTDLELFRPMPQEDARAVLGLPASEPMVLFNTGLAQKVKRLDLARAAVERAREEIPSLRMVVLEGKTPPERVPLFLNAADLLLVTSDSEGSPTIVREAMACNLPVVSVDVGDVKERLAGITPSRIVARDPASIAAGILDVLRARARSNGALAMAGLSNEAIARRLLAVYEAAIGG